MKTRILTHLKNPIFQCLVLIVLFTAGKGQEPIGLIDPKLPEFPQVKWVKQWPSVDNKLKPHGFRNRFNAIFLGKKMPVLTRPVNVFAVDKENFWVLDQEVMSIFSVKEGVGDIPHFLQKGQFDFSSLIGICEGPSNSMFVTDSHAGKIYRVVPEKKTVQVVNDTLLLNQPTGIAWSAITGEIWVVETNAHRITVLNGEGAIVKRIGLRGTAPGEFNYPTYIHIDDAGLIYIVDAMNFRIQVLKSSGEVVSVFGQQGDASGYFARPKGVATDSHGNIYIVDALFHTVQAFDLTGKYLISLGSQGHGEAEFWMPSGIYIDRDDFIYVADSYNSRVQVFQPVFGNKQY
jgi:DNA-binding beta-propeller fold protein YncE